MRETIKATAPVLLFDSGVGGLSVLAELRGLLPDAPVIYAADNAGLPYGTKSEAQIAARVAGLLGRMAERFHPRLICIACNTASTIALGMVRDVLEVPIVGTVPAIKPAAAMTRSGVIGLLGTDATIRQAYVDRLEEEFAQDQLLLRAAAPDLVEAAEAKLRGRPVDPGVYRRAADALRDQPYGRDIDTVVLACTHFPLIEDELAQASARVFPSSTVRRALPAGLPISRKGRNLSAPLPTLRFSRKTKRTSKSWRPHSPILTWNKSKSSDTDIMITGWQWHCT